MASGRFWLRQEAVIMIAERHRLIFLFSFLMRAALLVILIVGQWQARSHTTVGTACMKVRVVRIFNTYGPRMALDDGRVVSNFVAQALTDQDLTVYGDGQQTRSFQYVSDLIKGELS